MKKLRSTFGKYRHSRTALVCVVIFLLAALLMVAGNWQQDARMYSVDDLRALGLTEKDVLYIYPTRGNMTTTAEPTKCAATDLQSFLRLVEGLTQADVAPDMEQNAVSSLYRTLLFQGIPPVDGYIVGEIGGKAYAQRPDGVVCALPYTEYEFMLDLCKVVRPYPEELDPTELLGAVKAMTTLYWERTIPSVPEFDTRLPQNVNFAIPSVQTVHDFYIIDACPYTLSDITPPSGQYVAVVPCGNYYELQMGVTQADGQWQVDGVKVARSNIRMMQYPKNEDWRLVIFGPSVTDISGWGMSQLDRVELFNYKTGEILWQTDGLCLVGRDAWSEDGRYFAFNHETGQAQNRGLQVVLLDTAGMTAINLVAPDGKADSRLEVREWVSDSKLALDYKPKGQESQRVVYDLQSGAISAGQ